ncbi:MAG: carboxymuconolactone decarboxylase family protein [Acidobacteria bacterium]|nr:carboxymuconolactone decarboxylase family protein [Acidobacteriota bacterium]
MTNETPEKYVDTEPRMDYYNAFPAGIKALVAWGREINQSGIESSLLELVKMRASQMNGCAFCLDMHMREAMEAGETAQRLAVLPAWREAPLFTARERAALQWVEAITNIQQGHAPTAAYNEMRAHFNETEAVQLTMAITNINTWNRLAIAFRPHLGKRPAK